MLVRVTFPLTEANVMDQSARTVTAIVSPVLAVEFGLSASELGVLAACLFAAYAAAQLPLGVALDAFGARRVQAVMVFAAIGLATFALSPGFAGLAAARIVLGMPGLMVVANPRVAWHTSTSGRRRFSLPDVPRSLVWRDQMQRFFPRQSTHAIESGTLDTIHPPVAARS